MTALVNIGSALSLAPLRNLQPFNLGGWPGLLHRPRPLWLFALPPGGIAHPTLWKMFFPIRIRPTIFHTALKMPYPLPCPVTIVTVILLLKDPRLAEAFAAVLGELFQSLNLPNSIISKSFYSFFSFLLCCFLCFPISYF
jgi:hypothetical protein